MRAKITLTFGLIFLLLLVNACGRKTPVVSGVVSVCKNQYCGKVIDGKLKIVFKSYPKNGKFYDLLDATKGYERANTIRYLVFDWVLDSIKATQPGRSSDRGLPSSIAIEGKFQIDSSRLCRTCSAVYKKYDISDALTDREYQGTPFNELSRKEAESRRTQEFLSKDPRELDEMTDAEWYDYMESLSDDPVWKETARKQRQAKGIK